MTLNLSSNTRLRLEQEMERRRRRVDDGRAARFAYDAYPYDPINYMKEWLKWEPWRGKSGKPGQADVLDAYTTVLLQLHEQRAWEQGLIKDAQLRHWQPGQPIRNRLRVEAGHTVGKTCLAAGIVSHFFDNFKPSIVYTFAPSWDQINDLLWKEVRVHRQGNGLPGRVLETPEIKYQANHFAKGKATNNATNAGIERTQGQHGKYLLFVLDEAVGIPEFVWKAVDTMTAGGISIVVMLANPRLRRGRFYKERESKYVHNFRISCLNHPNVVLGREVVPGAVRREWVDRMIEARCAIVSEHDEDLFTFEVPWQPGLIFAPDNDFLYQVLGITPKFAADDTFVPVGRYEAALIREPMKERTDVAFMGADTARYGTDYGTLYVRYAGRAWRAAQFYKQDSFAYYTHIKRVALQLKEKGVKKLYIRLDGTGGFSSGVVDWLNMDFELERVFEEFVVHEIHFGSAAYDGEAYADIITEMYAEAAETLKGLRLDDPPDELEDDLCDRHYKPRNKQGRTVKAMEDKDVFRKRNLRSPDDGDGFVLAVAPEHIFKARPDEQTAVAAPRVVSRDELFG